MYISSILYSPLMKKYTGLFRNYCFVLSFKYFGHSFLGPVAGVVVGYIDGEFVLNPTPEQLEKSLLDLSVAGTKEAVNMVEAGAKELDEETMLKAILFAHENIKKICAFQEEFVKFVERKITLKRRSRSDDLFFHRRTWS